MAAAPESLIVDPGWRELLGMTDDEIADLGLRDLARLCLRKGVTPRITRVEGGRPGLHLVDDHEPLAIAG